MDRIILCETKEASVPYRFPDSGISILSYEELCFYIYNNPSLFLEGMVQEQLIDWIKIELKMEELANELHNLLSNNGIIRAQILCILTEKQFYSQGEVTEFFKKYDEMYGETSVIKKKYKADSLLTYNRYLRAGILYDDIIEEIINLEHTSFLGNVYHNKGLCLAKNFEFGTAKDYFFMAYEQNQNIESAMEYMLLFYLGDENGSIREEMQRLNLAIDFYTDFTELTEKLMERLRDQPDYRLIEKASLNKSQGHMDDYYKQMGRLIERWKKDYRRQTT